MALLVAAALVGLAVWLGRRSRAAFSFAVVLLAAMILASIFDQFGLADLAFVIATLIPLILLIRDRAWYLRLPGVNAEQRAG
jgi:amino acid permease